MSAANHSFAALRASKQCVIAIPGVDLIRKVVAIGNCSGRDVDKFATCGITSVPAPTIKPPLIAECLANLECRVKSAAWAGRYNFFILQVVKAWINPARKERRTMHHNGDGTFVIDGRTINLKKQMVNWQSFI